MKKLLCCLMGVLFVLTGCSQSTPPQTTETADMTEPPPATTEATAEPAKLLYLTSHETVPSGSLCNWKDEIQTKGFVWEDAEITDISADAKILIYDFPKEDLTTSEFKLLNNYLSSGGHLLLLLPPSESETRYKFLDMLLEPFCIQIDYNEISETDSARVQTDESIALNPLSVPEHMPNAGTDSVFMKHLRSFQMRSEESNMELYMDALLQTAPTAVGNPYGGTQDDPVTYENQPLNIMLYSRDAMRDNASVVVVGSSDFLLDENYTAETSRQAEQWIDNSLLWFRDYH